MSIDGLREWCRHLIKETMLNCQCVRLLTEEYLAYAGRDSPELVQAASICDVGRCMYRQDPAKGSGLSLAGNAGSWTASIHGMAYGEEYGVPDGVAGRSFPSWKVAFALAGYSYGKRRGLNEGKNDLYL